VEAFLDLILFALIQTYIKIIWIKKKSIPNGIKLLSKMYLMLANEINPNIESVANFSSNKQYIL